MGPTRLMRSKNPGEADEAKANEADEAKANAADKAIVADEIVTANDAAAGKLPIDNKHILDSIILYFLFGWQPFSLTKYCVIFSKDKGYFVQSQTTINLE